MISQFEVTPYSVPFLSPWQTARGTYTHREGIWLKLQWQGFVGNGEAAPLQNISRENLKEIHYALDEFHKVIEDENYGLEELQLLIEVHTQDLPSARFALETAVFDSLAQESNKSLAEYLNPHYKSQIAVNGIAGLHQPSDGFNVIKVKMGFHNLFDEIENMEYLTQTYGDIVQFRLDLNAALDLPKAIRFCKEMEKFNIDYIEQPLAKDNLEDLAELRYHTTIPIAVDESLTDYPSAEKLIEMQAADVFIIKPMISGGFTECSKIIELAKSRNIRAVITTSLETSIGRSACIHLAAANEIIEPCGLATEGLLIEDCDKIPIKEGNVSISKMHGLGIELHV